MSTVVRELIDNGVLNQHDVALLRATFRDSGNVNQTFAVSSSAIQIQGGTTDVYMPQIDALMKVVDSRLPVVNVQLYGAVPGQDCTAAYITARSVAILTGANLYFPADPSPYYLSTSINLKNDSILSGTRAIGLLGDGMYSSTIIFRLDTSTDCVTAIHDNTDTVYAGRIENIRILADGRTKGRDIIAIEYAAWWSIHNVSLGYAGRYGLRIKNSQDMVIDTVHAEENQSAGIKTETASTNTTCWFYNVDANLTQAGPGFDIGGFSCHLTNCNSESNTGNGYKISGLGLCSMRGCYSENNSSDIIDTTNCRLWLENMQFTLGAASVATGKYGLKANNGSFVDIVGGLWDAFTGGTWGTVWIDDSNNVHVNANGFPPDAPTPVLGSGANFDTYVLGTWQMVGADGKAHYRGAVIKSTNASGQPCLWVLNKGGRIYHGGSDVYSAVAVSAGDDRLQLSHAIDININQALVGSTWLRGYSSGVQIAFGHKLGYWGGAGLMDSGEAARIGVPANGTNSHTSTAASGSTAHVTDTSATYSSGNLLGSNNNGTNKFLVDYQGTVCAGTDSDGGWNHGHSKIGNYHIWIDSSGRLRIKSSAPTGDTDGTVVGTQS